MANLVDRELQKYIIVLTDDTVLVKDLVENTFHDRDVELVVFDDFSNRAREDNVKKQQQIKHFTASEFRVTVVEKEGSRGFDLLMP